MQYERKCSLLLLYTLATIVKRLHVDVYVCAFAWCHSSSSGETRRGEIKRKSDHEHLEWTSSYFLRYTEKKYLSFQDTFSFIMQVNWWTIYSQCQWKKRQRERERKSETCSACFFTIRWRLIDEWDGRLRVRFTDCASHFLIKVKQVSLCACISGRFIVYSHSGERRQGNWDKFECHRSFYLSCCVLIWCEKRR